ncbi:MAG: type II secretion system protein [bacterium]
MNKLNSKKGFTLAETLMTLALVGVLAATTMGIILPTIQDAQYKTEYKTVYSELDQATKMIMMDNGNSLKGVFLSNANMRNKYNQYLNFIKTCENGLSFGNCWHKMDGSSKLLNGAPITSWSDYAGAILNNGALLRIVSSSSNCTAVDGSLLKCGYMYLDINGFKGPNTMGKDIQLVQILENGIKPAGAGDSFGNSCTTSSGGWSCATEYLKGQ